MSMLVLQCMATGLTVGEQLPSDAANRPQTCQRYVNLFRLHCCGGLGEGRFVKGQVQTALLEPRKVEGDSRWRVWLVAVLYRADLPRCSTEMRSIAKGTLW